MARKITSYGCSSNSRRVACYVDGFNLYFGLKSQNWSRYYWLDIWLLAENLLRNCRLESVKYFTACVKDDVDKVARQQAYLGALRYKNPNMEIFYGKYLFKDWQCRQCGSVWKKAEEKKTDVNIATEMLTDAFNDKFDVALLISGDSDIVPPIDKIHNERPDKKIIVGFPPGRQSHELKQRADSFLYINHKTLRISLLPNPVLKPDGTKLCKPQQWR